MEKLKQAVIALYHQDCQTSIISEKFPEIKMKQTSPIICFNKKPDIIDYQLVWEIDAPSSGYLDNYIDFMKKYKKTKNLTVLSKELNRAVVLHRANGPNSSYEAVMKNNVIYSSPVEVHEGYETHSVIATDPKNMKKLLREMNCIGESKILRIGDYKPNITTDFELTEKQKEALRMALINGYYEWPKRVTLEELAKIANTSRRSLQERLRRAERKVLPRTIEKILED